MGEDGLQQIKGNMIAAMGTFGRIPLRSQASAAACQQNKFLLRDQGTFPPQQ